jgi:hypothetical protein
MELDAPTRWKTLDFVSDLHLQDSSPRTLQGFIDYLDKTPADAVFVLGDLLEYWIGDDWIEEPQDAQPHALSVRLGREQLGLASVRLAGHHGGVDVLPVLREVGERVGHHRHRHNPDSRVNPRLVTHGRGEHGVCGVHLCMYLGHAGRTCMLDCLGHAYLVRCLAGAATHVDLAQAVSVRGVAGTPVVSSHNVLALVLPPHRHARRDGCVHAAVVALDRDRVAAGLVVRLLDEVAEVRHLGRSREKSWVVNVR